MSAVQCGAPAWRRSVRLRAGGFCWRGASSQVNETMRDTTENEREQANRMELDGVDVRPYDTLHYQPTAGGEVEAVVQAVTSEGLDVRVAGSEQVQGLATFALREAEAEGRIRVAPAAGRVGEGEVATEDHPNLAEQCGLELPPQEGER